MARPLRLRINGGVYHVMIRSNSYQLLFRDDHDRKRYLELLGRYQGRFGFTVYAYTLSTRQVDLVIETPKATNISKVMQCLGTSYCCYFNRRHGRRGTLFDGRFRSYLVDKESHLAEVTRHIHRAPLKIGWKILRDYPWSSYRIYLGKATKGVFVEKGAVLRLFGEEIRDQRKEYQKFVESSTFRASPYPGRVHFQQVVGSSDFAGKVLARNQESDGDGREEALRRAEKILKEVSFWLSHGDMKDLRVDGKRALVRHLAMYLIRRNTSLPLRSIGELFGVKAPAVVLALRNVERLLSRNDFSEKLKGFTEIGSLSVLPGR